MKPNPRNVVHTIGEVEQETRMSIDKEAMAHIMSLLTDLYSDPQMAVIREYSSNALDSHIEAGNTDPIEVTLPTNFEPTLVIQDRGVGLNVDDMRDIYSLYGKSTKRGTNDAVGMLGLGCKSGLTYALSFSVVGIKNGVKTSSIVTKDSDGVGVIKILDTCATDEPNGVKVSIPVDSYDIQSFRYKADELFKYWKPGTVLVNGEQPAFNEANLWLDDDVCIFPEWGKSHIVMGNVPYPFTHTLQGFQHSIVAWVPIGSVDFAPSREALMETALTKSTIAEVQAFVEERFSERVKEEMDGLSTAYDRISYAHTWRNVPKIRQLLGEYKYTIDIPEDRPAWNKAWRGYTKIEVKVGTETILGDKPIITEFPNKTVSPAHRNRINEYGVDHRGLLILPIGTDLTALEGRDNVVTWQHVLDNTTEPVKAKRGTRSAPKVDYDYWMDNKYHHGQLDTNKPIAWTGMRESNGRWYPGVQVVQLYAKDIPRFQRLYPTAQHLTSLIPKLRDENFKKITEADKIKKSLTWSNLAAALKRVQDRIDDADVITLIKAISGDHSQAWKNWKAYGGNQYASGIKTPDLVTEVTERYPLLPKINYDADLNEVVFYINTKSAQAE